MAWVLPAFCPCPYIGFPRWQSFLLASSHGLLLPEAASLPRFSHGKYGAWSFPKLVFWNLFSSGDLIHTVPSIRAVSESGENVGPIALFPGLKIRVSWSILGFSAIGFVQHIKMTFFGVKLWTWTFSVFHKNDRIGLTKSLSVSLFSIKSCYPIDSVVSIIIWKIEDDTFFWPQWKVKNTSLFFLILYSVRSFKALLRHIKKRLFSQNITICNNYSSYYGWLSGSWRILIHK